MKTLFWIAILFVALPLGLFAQSCDDKLYKEYLAEADNYFKQANYLQAVNSYSSALAICPKNAQFVKDKLRGVFVEINKLKENAEIAKKKATQAQKTTKETLVQVEKQQRIINFTLSQMEVQKNIAVENLQKANKLINAFYFAYDRFALAYGKTSDLGTGDYNKFYFIDKNGDRVEKLGEWDKAEQFNVREYGNGLTKVWKEQVEYYLDTLGNAYQVAYRIADLNAYTKALDLSNIQLDSFPTEILAYSQLEVLILENTKFVTLPTEIAQLKKLRVLQLRSCGLDSLSAQISELKNLTSLDLISNRLSFFPAQILELKNLTKLDLSQNQLSSLPEQIEELKNLQSLDLGLNQLSSLPEQIGKLKNLQTLSLFGNDLESLPEQIGKLKNLQTLDLRFNRLSNFPEQIGELKNLRELKLRENKLNNLPEQIEELKSLQTLDLSFNQLSNLPEQIGELKSLQTLNLDRNQLSSLPEQIGELKNLQWLDLGSNQLSSLPEQIGELKNLQWLDLSFNQLSSLPEQIGEFKNLQNLYLSGNQLSSLPDQIGEWKNLQRLYLDRNRLTELPSQIGELKNLQKLDLSQNQLTELPSQIGELKNLRDLYLGYNELSSLPEQIWELKNLQDFRLDGNQLNSLSEQISELKNLRYLSLSYNPLNSLPEQIGELKYLKTLNLSQNQLSSLPAKIWELKNLEEFDLNANGLGSLPEQIGELKNLRKLNLSQNQLSNLPEQIGELKNLEELNLRANGLGSLPEQIRELKNLRELDLSQNQLSNLPEQIKGLKNLEKIKLKYNRSIFLPKLLEKFLENKTDLEKEEFMVLFNPEKRIELNLSNLSMSSLPAQMGELKNLITLNLSNNPNLDFKSIFKKLNKYTKLTYLDLTNNKLAFLPMQIGELNNLITLDLRYNTDLSLASLCGAFANYPKKIYLTTDDNVSNNKTDILLIKISKQSSLPVQIGEIKNLVKIDLKNNPLMFLPKSLEHFLKDKTDLSKDKLNYLYNQEAFVQALITYRLDNQSPINASYYRQGHELSKIIIEAVQSGIIRPFQKNAVERLIYEDFIKNLTINNEELKSDDSNFYFEIQQTMSYSKKALVSNDFSFVALYYRISDTERRFVGNFDKEELFNNVFQEDPSAIWVNPLNIIDQRYYHEALFQGFYEGKLVNFQDLKTGHSKNISSQKDLDSLQKAFGIKNLPFQKNTFTLAQTEQTAFDTLVFGQKSYHSVMPDTLPITDIWYEVITKDTTLKNFLYDAFAEELIVPFENDSLITRMTYESRLERYNNLQRPKISNSKRMEIKFSLFFSKKREKIISKLINYKSKISRDSNSFGFINYDPSISLYIKSHSSDQYDLLASYNLSEVLSHLRVTNESKKFKIRPISYRNPITGERIDIKDSKDLDLLKNCMGKQANEVDQLFLESNFLDFKE